VSSHHPMSHADAAWLRMDRATNLMIINSLMWFDEPPDWDRLSTVYVEQIVNCFPRFRHIARPGGLMGGAHWEDDPQFDPQDHFHRIALPAPHNRAALRALVGDLATAPLDHERALWDVYLIDDFAGGAAVLTRVHHAVGDGIALARVLLSATDAGDPGPGFGERDGQRSALATVLHGGLSTVGHPRRAATRAVTDLGTLSKLLLPGGEHSHVLKGEGHVGHQGRVERPGRPVAGQAHRARVPRNRQRRVGRGAVRRAALAHRGLGRRTGAPARARAAEPAPARRTRAR
jgi:hypothetical protein